MTDARPPLQRNGFEYRYVYLNRDIMEKLLDRPELKKTLIEFQEEDEILDVAFMDTEEGIVATIKLKRGLQQIGQFIVDHCDKYSTSFEAIKLNGHILIECYDSHDAIVNSLNIDKDSL